MNPIKFWEVEVLIFVLFNSFIPSMICSSMKDRVLAFTFLGGNIDGLIAIFWNLVICFSTAIVRVKGIAKSENSVFPIYKSVYNLHIYIYIYIYLKTAKKTGRVMDGLAEQVLNGVNCDSRNS